MIAAKHCARSQVSSAAFCHLYDAIESSFVKNSFVNWVQRNIVKASSTRHNKLAYAPLQSAATWQITTAIFRLSKKFSDTFFVMLLSMVTKLQIFGKESYKHRRDNYWAAALLFLPRYPASLHLGRTCRLTTASRSQGGGGGAVGRPPRR